MKLVILNGYPGSGKTVLSYKYSKTHDFALIAQDHFLFRMNPSSMITRHASQRDQAIALENLLTVTENYMKTEKDIMIEGAMVSISSDDPMNIGVFVQLAEKHNYQPIIITLTASERVRKRRQLSRGNTVNPSLDKKLIKANSLLEFADITHQLDTSRLTMKKCLDEIDRIIGE